MNSLFKGSYDRLRGLMAVALLSVVAATPLQAKTLKIATLSPDGSNWMKMMRKGGKEVEQRTEGRVKFKFYPGGVMGNDAAVLRKIRLGQLQGGAMSGGSLAKFAPDSQVYNMPLKFRSFEEVDYIRERMDETVAGAIEKGGFVNFGLAEGGLAYIMSNTAVASVNELRTKKVWIPDNDPAAATSVKAFGVSPIPLSIGDVLPGLQTGLVDTVASSPIATIALQWHTQVKHMTDLPLLYFYAVMAIDKKAFKRISAADQASVREVMSNVFKQIDAQNRKDNIAAFEALQKQGVAVVSPANEAEWRQFADNAVNELLSAGLVSRPVYQRFDKLLMEYRSQQQQAAADAN